MIDSLVADFEPAFLLYAMTTVIGSPAVVACIVGHAGREGSSDTFFPDYCLSEEATSYAIRSLVDLGVYSLLAATGLCFHLPKHVLRSTARAGQGFPSVSCPDFHVGRRPREYQDREKGAQCESAAEVSASRSGSSLEVEPSVLLNVLLVHRLMGCGKRPPAYDPALTSKKKTSRVSVF